MRGDPPAPPSSSVAPGPIEVLLVAALLREVRPFLRRAAARPRGDLGRPAWEVAVREGRALLLVAGPGPEAAARAAAAALCHAGPRVLVSLGFGGALTPEPALGEVVLGETCWQFDPERGSLRAISPPPPRPLAELLRLLQDAGLPAGAGSLVTAPGIIHKAVQGRPLTELFRPVLDLESAPLAELAATRGLAFLGLRAVTDGAGEEIPEFIREACQAGEEPGLAAAFSWAARDPRRFRFLIRMWRRSRVAAQELARALEVLLPLL